MTPKSWRGADKKDYPKGRKMEKEYSFIEAMFIVNQQRIDAILQYRKGGGLDRVVETSRQLNDLTEHQIRLIELMQSKEAKDSEGD